MTDHEHQAPWVVAALYQFVDFTHYEEVREELKSFCDVRGIKGLLLLAREGLNGTVAGRREAIDELLLFLKNDALFRGLFTHIEHKESFSEQSPFYRMKVKLKREIVTLGQPDVNPSRCVGTYVEPEAWNALISAPDLLLIDTRNDYEYAIGTFKGALNPATMTFREFPEFVEASCDPLIHKRVAMFCTGGIRCEKASAYMLQQGFETVYHLKGGILKYLERIPEAESLWQGECFVFDNRVAVTHGLHQGRYDLCHACRLPISPEDKQSSHFQEGISCPHCISSLTARKKARFQERQRQIALAKSRNEQHLGVNPKTHQRVCG